MPDHPLFPLSVHSAAPNECPRPVRLEVLSRTPLFSELPREEIIEIEGRTQAPGYRTGEAIYRVGDGADSLFVVASGTVKLIRPFAQGTCVVVSILGSGEGFGTLGTVDRYAESAEAMTVTCVVKIPARVVREVMERHPRVALAALDEALQRLERSQQAIERLSVGKAGKRVSAALLALADTVGYPEADRIDLEVPLTRADLASMARTTPETVSRVLSRLRHEGVVDFGRRWTSVVDRSRLAMIAAE